VRVCSLRFRQRRSFLSYPKDPLLRKGFFPLFWRWKRFYPSLPVVFRPGQTPFPCPKFRWTFFFFAGEDSPRFLPFFQEVLFSKYRPFFFFGKGGGDVCSSIWCGILLGYPPSKPRLFPKNTTPPFSSFFFWEALWWTVCPQDHLAPFCP